MSENVSVCLRQWDPLGCNLSKPIWLHVYKRKPTAAQPDVVQAQLLMWDLPTIDPTTVCVYDANACPGGVATFAFILGMAQ